MTKEQFWTCLDERAEYAGNGCEHRAEARTDDAIDGRAFTEVVFRLQLTDEQYEATNSGGDVYYFIQPTVFRLARPVRPDTAGRRCKVYEPWRPEHQAAVERAKAKVTRWFEEWRVPRRDRLFGTKFVEERGLLPA